MLTANKVPVLDFGFPSWNWTKAPASRGWDLSVIPARQNGNCCNEEFAPSPMFSVCSLTIFP